ncbi:MAG: adenylyl-sulfate kinase [Candidatus Omnitrophica bacterium]|nr:adenylyl-sulfate kinase [Candidatus Omnitrophota bacterium]
MGHPAAAPERMALVVVGHVDHGKSTLVGRLLADTGSLPRGKLEQVREDCRRNAKPFEYAFLLDALKEEQRQGITIDTARVFFQSAARAYVLIDAPGHIEFLKNMVSGATRAEAALLVIDAQEGIQENSKRHGYLLSMLGIRQVAVCVNKMDLVGYRREAFEAIERDYREFLRPIGLRPTAFIPLAAREGENLIRPSARMPWYRGPTVLAALDAFEPAPPIDRKPFRMPVQGVYKFTEAGDARRIVAGRAESGTLAVGDPVVFLPSGKRTTIHSIEAFHAPPPTRVRAGLSTGVTLDEQLYIPRGDVLCRVGESLPQVSSLLRVKIFWMGRRPMTMQRPYKLKLATAETTVRLKAVEQVIDAATLKAAAKRELGRHDVAQCVLHTTSAIAFDAAGDLAATGRFVLVDEYDIAGGGIVLEAIDDGQSAARRRVLAREQHWDVSVVPWEERAGRYGHRPAFLLLTGKVGVAKQAVAKALEARLFRAGAKTYLLGMGNLLRGLNADVEQHRLERQEQVRRMGEVAHLFVDAGLIVIATGSDLNDGELAALHEVIGRDPMLVINVGPNALAQAVVDLQFDSADDPARCAARIAQLLADRQIATFPPDA